MGCETRPGLHRRLRQPPARSGISRPGPTRRPVRQPTHVLSGGVGFSTLIFFSEEYAVELFEEWGIGKEEDNGLLILICTEGEPGKRPLRIEVGTALKEY